jgi:hypothetical protein
MTIESIGKPEKSFAVGKTIAIEAYVKDFGETLYEREINGSWINAGDEGFGCEVARLPAVRQPRIPSKREPLEVAWKAVSKRRLSLAALN